MNTFIVYLKQILLLWITTTMVSCFNGKNVTETANQDFTTKIYKTDTLNYPLTAHNQLIEIPRFDESLIEGKLLTMLFNSVFIDKVLQETFRTDSSYCYQNNLSFYAIGHPESLFLSSDQSDILFYETRITPEYFMIIRHFELLQTDTIFK